MANAEKLRNAIQVIRENQHRWSQRTFVDGPVNVNTLNWEECGTTLCLAGWGCVLEGLRPNPWNADGDHPNDLYAMGTFHHPDRPEESINPFYAAVSIFELTESEANYLFLNMTEDIDVLESAVDRVIDGELSFSRWTDD